MGSKIFARSRYGVEIFLFGDFGLLSAVCGKADVVSRLAAAQSFDQVVHLFHNYEVQLELAKECDHQLLKQQVPASCYGWLQRNNPSNKENSLRRLDLQCENVSRKVMNVDYLKRVFVKGRVSKNCRRSIKERIHTLNYQNENLPLISIQEIL